MAVDVSGDGGKGDSGDAAGDEAFSAVDVSLCAPVPEGGGARAGGVGAFWALGGVRVEMRW